MPEPLRRVADLVLTLPRIDRRLFPRIFTRVFEGPPPANWDRGGPDWTRYLIAADFHAPRRLKLTASQAVREYLGGSACVRACARYPRSIHRRSRACMGSARRARWPKT